MVGTRTACLLVCALSVGTAGCPLLAEDDFVLVAPGDLTPSGQGGSGGAAAGSGGTTTAGASGAAGSGGMGGVAPPPACAPCADGELCRSDGDCESGRCSAAGTCRACGLRLTSVQTACPASCTRCDAGVCYVECASDGDCKEATVLCPPHLACHVVCAGEQACEAAVVECPAEFPCDVSCSGKQSCKGMAALCGSGPCGLGCAADGACKESSLQCADDRCEAKCSGGADVPQVTCGESCDCAACSG
jgi:hypothetical protein